MAIIVDRCGACERDMALVPKDVQLYTFAPVGRDYYQYRCPYCRLVVRSWASARIVAALRTGKVREMSTVLPREVLDPVRDGSPMLASEVVAFLTGLDELTWLPDELLA